MKTVFRYVLSMVVSGRINRLMIVGAPVLALALALWMGSGADPAVKVQMSLSMSFIVQLFGAYMALAGVVVTMRSNGSLLWLFDRGFRQGRILTILMLVGAPLAFAQSLFVLLGVYASGIITTDTMGLAILGALLESLGVSAAGILVGTISRDVAILQWASLPLLLLGALAINLAPAFGATVTALVPFGVGMAIGLAGAGQSALLVVALVIAVGWSLVFLVASKKMWSWSDRG
ncbi:hypothetical protein [Corynebacterium liangguodongii]|uniref:Uncharacterized protein n=1 Tax=Corynebacterium liangguodongii TaxID=2079535 RepID=A0A2S0WEU9_9CORY|nr:hypothetical protein [Corynebacterium liangguodongii]AWB84289.1 hypothetical protein C3E79_07180 [Corynebacterium liangguodongii]PWB98582.1 hypothetical protein DF219_11155 [Corynebacterium liangguodongii]